MVVAADQEEDPKASNFSCEQIKGQNRLNQGRESSRLVVQSIDKNEKESKCHLGCLFKFILVHYSAKATNRVYIVMFHLNEHRTLQSKSYILGIWDMLVAIGTIPCKATF